MADRIVSVETHKHLIPCRITDANGHVVRHVRKANLDTGECEVFATNPDGSIAVANGAAVVNHDRRPAPLSVVKTVRA